MRSALLSLGIHLMSRDWIHLLCLSICFCHADTSLQFLSLTFSFLTSSENRNSIEHNLIPSAPALDTCTCFDQSCEVELCLCPAKRGRKKSCITAEMKSFFERNSSSVLFHYSTKNLSLPLMCFFFFLCMKWKPCFFFFLKKKNILSVSWQMN